MVQSIKRSRKWPFPVTRTTGVHNDHLVTDVHTTSSEVDQFGGQSGILVNVGWNRLTGPRVISRELHKQLSFQINKLALVIGKRPYGPRASGIRECSKRYSSCRTVTLLQSSKLIIRVTWHVLPYMCTSLTYTAARVKKIRRIIRHVCTSQLVDYN
jgi:hypothetical protein